MTEETVPQTIPPKRKGLRRALWILLGGLLLVIVVQALFSKLDLALEDRIALIRIEGVILDSRQAVDDIKKFGDTDTVKAIVLRIDSPGG
ncbi:MAG: hypothetical protein ACREI3_10535, partial [Nitrospirales bacterium]